VADLRLGIFHSFHTSLCQWLFFASHGTTVQASVDAKTEGKRKEEKKKKKKRRKKKTYPTPHL
jgi:hypothetical protein